MVAIVESMRRELAKPTLASSAKFSPLPVLRRNQISQIQPEAATRIATGRLDTVRVTCIYSERKKQEWCWLLVKSVFGVHKAFCAQAHLRDAKHSEVILVLSLGGDRAAAAGWWGEQRWVQGQGVCTCLPQGADQCVEGQKRRLCDLNSGTPVSLCPAASL